LFRSFAVGKGTNYTITTLGEYSGSAGMVDNINFSIKNMTAYLESDVLYVF